MHVKGVVRRVMLGALQTPAHFDSARVTIRRRSNSWADDTTAVVRDTVLRLSEFGTLVDSVRLRPGLVLGNYVADLRVVVGSQWRTIRSTGFRLAEYRAPDFLVDLTTDTKTRYADDTVTVHVRGQYLFGAPMRRAIVKWTAETDEHRPPLLRIPYAAGWIVGGRAWWMSGSNAMTADRLSGINTLDGDGRARIRIPVAALGSVSGILEINAAVVDLNGQAVTATTSAPVSSSRVFVLTRVVGKDRSWRVGEPVGIEVRAVDPRGAPARDVVVRAVVLRHRRQVSNPLTGVGAHWAIDTLHTDQLRPAGGTASFSFTPLTAGDYAIELSATDDVGGSSRTTVQSVVTSALTNKDTVTTVTSTAPLGYHVVLTAEKSRVSVGEMARVHFDSPFRDAEAWITVEREGILEQRRQRVTRGDNVVAVRIAERHVPNVFVSVVLLARDDSATRPDTASERLRAGYVELYVARDRRQLSVALATDSASYSPRDTAAIRVRVRDAAGRGVRSEVALWAVDEGVLALTGFATPDILPQLYAPRGVGGQLWSTVLTMLTTDPNLITAFMQPSGMFLAEMATNTAIVVRTAQGAKGIASGTLRSRFNSTAFYLGAVETDERGDAVAHAAIPDNLTTFRVMAVAVSTDDRYGHGDTTLLVTRQLVARPALPRFIRPSDSLVAGVVVTTRDGRSRVATADASATGLALRGPARMSVSLSSGASAKARFVVTAPGRNAIGDSVAVRLGATDGVDRDATETWLPVRPDFHPRAHAILGAVRDSQDVSLVLPADIDPRRSRMRLRIGTSRLSTMLAAYRWLRAYRFDCTEQLASVGRGIVAVWQATKRERPDALGGDPSAKLQELVDEISRRQRSDGAIKYWPNWEWTSPWLTAHAGLFLLDARDVGVAVDPGVIARASAFLKRASRAAIDTGGMNRYEQRERRLALGDRVAAVDYLRRAGAADTA
ncbi:MAG: alpha-2-macroglobulin family protein, partial [Gemmatimonas sp.]